MYPEVANKLLLTPLYYMDSEDISMCFSALCSMIMTSRVVFMTCIL